MPRKIASTFILAAILMSSLVIAPAPTSSALAATQPGRYLQLPPNADPADPATSCIYRENSPAWADLVGTVIVLIVAVVFFVSSLLDLPKSGNSAGSD